MLKTIIIADDNTGANASGILLNKLNFRTLSLIEYDKTVDLSRFDALAVSTDSRAVESEEAYTRVFNVLSSFQSITSLLYNKRIDSTLRGNLGSEIEAFINFFPMKKIAIVPAFPNSKRTCIDGKIYVDGKQLADTDVAKDPKMPIHSSVAKDLIRKQSNRRIANIYYTDVRGNKNLSTLIRETYKDNDMIIFDAETNKDIEIISAALYQSKVDIISVDPGPFTFYYSRIIEYSLHKKQEKYIYLVGSVVDTTFEQIKYLRNDDDFEVIYANPERLLNNDKNLISDVIEQAISSDKRFIVITTTDVSNRVILNLKEIAEKNALLVDDVSKIINDNLATILTTILESTKIAGVFCSGGDTSLGFLNSINAKGIKLIAEVIPLCVFGNIVGGRFDGLPIITKGGMIGGNDSYIKIKNYFEEAVTNV